jgi:hypothetical protein
MVLCTRESRSDIASRGAENDRYNLSQWGDKAKHSYSGLSGIKRKTRLGRENGMKKFIG